MNKADEERRRQRVKTQFLKRRDREKGGGKKNAINF